MSKPIVPVFTVGNRVVLKENPKHKGKVMQVMQPYTAGDPYFYYVLWDGMGTQYFYLPEVLILESEFEKSGEFYAAGDAKPPIA